MTSNVTTSEPAVLADVLPRVHAIDAALLLAGASLTVIGAQVSIHVPPSPVPITGQTLAVVVAGASLGSRRGALSQALYVLIGLFLPVYADGAQGWHVVWGASGGYLVGFIVAAWIVGRLAERGADRHVLTAFVAFLLGQAAIFGIGVPWLQAVTGMPWATALHEGFTIFIVGGLVKAAIAGGLVPVTWRAVREISNRHRGE